MLLWFRESERIRVAESQRAGTSDIFAWNPELKTIALSWPVNHASLVSSSSKQGRFPQTSLEAVEPAPYIFIYSLALC